MCETTINCLAGAIACRLYILQQHCDNDCFVVHSVQNLLGFLLHFTTSTTITVKNGCVLSSSRHKIIFFKSHIRNGIIFGNAMAGFDFFD